MNYLLDTHLLIWAASNSQKLPKAAADIIIVHDNSLRVSVGSFWEIAIKRSKFGSEFPFEVGPLRAGLLSNGYEELAIETRHDFVNCRLRVSSIWRFSPGRLRMLLSWFCHAID
jgi:PIN domain nuclease of toxin-antitoxin system